MTLDETWVEAEALGRPKVERDYGNTKKYSASIYFSTPGGSLVSASGSSTESPQAALSAALREARALRAGYEFATP